MAKLLMTEIVASICMLALYVIFKSGMSMTKEYAAFFGALIVSLGLGIVIIVGYKVNSIDAPIAAAACCAVGTACGASSSVICDRVTLGIIVFSFIGCLGCVIGNATSSLIFAKKTGTEKFPILLSLGAQILGIVTAIYGFRMLAFWNGMILLVVLVFARVQPKMFLQSKPIA